MQNLVIRNTTVHTESKNTRVLKKQQTLYIKHFISHETTQYYKNPEINISIIYPNILKANTTLYQAALISGLLLEQL